MANFTRGDQQKCTSTLNTPNAMHPCKPPKHYRRASIARNSDALQTPPKHRTVLLAPIGIPSAQYNYNKSRLAQ